MNKSLEAAFLAWCEDLRANEAQFMSEKIMSLGKKRVADAVMRCV